MKIVNTKNKLSRIIVTLMGLILVFLFTAPPALALVNCCKCTTKDDPKTNICIKTTEPDCSAMPAKSSNPQVKTLECESLGEADKGQCRSISNGGICAKEPIEDSLFSSSASDGTTTTSIAAPKLGIQIPGLQFATEVVAKGGYLQLPFLAQYIDAVYKYMVGVAAVAAAIMIVYGGFIYIVGSSGIQIQQGKTIILDATIGLLLLLGAYTILSTINPDTVVLKPVRLMQVGREPFNAAASRALVEQAATVRAPSAVEIPVLDLTNGPVAPAQPAPTPETPAAKPGEIAKDPLGNLVAQGNCPPGMVPIESSPEYEQATGVKVASFCIDRFEAPNQQGSKPLLGVNEWEAEWHCNERGKRLCNELEWVRACLGPQGKNAFGYGPEFIPGLWVTAGNPPESSTWSVLKKGGTEPGKCNYDTPSKNVIVWGRLQRFYIQYPTKKPEDSILNPNNPNLSNPKYKKLFDELKTEVDRMDQSEPSGARQSCATSEGVFDMTGNVSEMVVKKAFINQTTEQRIAQGPATGAAKPYNWMGFYWSPIAHKATSQDKPSCTFGAGPTSVGSVHGAGSGWRDYANGFRCCLSLAER